MCHLETPVPFRDRSYEKIQANDFMSAAAYRLLAPPKI